MKEEYPDFIYATNAPLRAKPSVYPPMLADRVKGREKRLLGDVFGLTNYGVNLTRLPPGAASSLRHAHAKQDEIVYILEGCPTAHQQWQDPVVTWHVRGIQGRDGQCPLPHQRNNGRCSLFGNWR